MADEKLKAALGFAMRSGNCVCGETGCEKTFKSGKALAIVLDASASPSTLERWQHRCGEKAIVLNGASQAVGKSNTMVIAVTDGGFAKMIIDAYESTK